MSRPTHASAQTFIVARNPDPDSSLPHLNVFQGVCDLF